MFSIDSLQTTLSVFVSWATTFFEALQQIQIIEYLPGQYYTLFDFCISMIVFDIIAIIWWRFRGYAED